MATTAERLRQALEMRGMKQAELSAVTGIGKSSISTYLSGEYLPKQRNIYKMAKALDVSEAWLMGEDVSEFRLSVVSSADESQTSVVDVPFLGDVAAGFDWLANPEYGCLRVPSDWLRGHRAANFFALRVVGSSMYPMFCEGDEILCLRTPDMGASGRIGVIVYNGDEVTLKKIVYKRGEDWLDLVPINPEYQTKRIEGADLEQCRVLGRVLRVIRTVDEM